MSSRAVIVQVGNPCLLGSTMSDKENVQTLQLRGGSSWEKQTATLAEQHRRRPQRVAEGGRLQRRLRDEAERRSHAENCSSRRSRSPQGETASSEADEAERCATAIEGHAAFAGKAAEAVAAIKAEQAAKERARLEAEEKVTEWCQKHGFQDMHTQKKTFVGATKFPLHTAVKYKDHSIIRLMLLAGAQKNVKDSKMQTPSELAVKLNKDGSRNEVILMLI